MAEMSVSSQAESGAQQQGGVRAASGSKRNFLPFWLLMPAILVLLVVQVGPSIYSLWLSTTRVRGGVMSNVGLDNYMRLLQTTTFRIALEKTLVYAVAYIVLTIVLGVGIAILLNRRVKYTGFYLVAIFVPWVVSDVVAGTMWRWMFQPTYGFVQEFFTQNLPFLGGSLYTNPDGAMAIVVIASVWQGMAFTTILSLGALQTVPKSVLESAAIDGANSVQRFLSITLPLIRPTLLVLLLLQSIRAINSAGLIFTTTRGGPGRSTTTASIYLLRTGWERGDFGTGAAISVILLVINLALTVFYLRVIGMQGRNE